MKNLNNTTEYNEYHSSGSVRWKLYFEYFTSGYGLFGAFLIVFIFLASQFLYTFSEYWLAYWSSQETELYSNITTRQVEFNNTLAQNSKFQQERKFNVMVYSGIFPATISTFL